MTAPYPAAANAADFFGETNGVGFGAPTVLRPNRSIQEIQDELDRQTAHDTSVRLASVPYGTPQELGGTAQTYQVSVPQGPRTTTVKADGTQTVTVPGTSSAAGTLDPNTGAFTPAGAPGAASRAFDPTQQGFSPDATMAFAQQQLGNPANTSAPTGAAPSTVDRTRIDALLGNVNTATSGLLGLAANDQDLSLAQAQLAQGAEAASRAALGQARSGNTRDRALNERAAVGEGAALAQDANRQASVLRAQEEADNKKIRIDAYKAAGDLGLNAGALDLNAQSVDINAATNYLNQLFDTKRTGMQIDAANAGKLVDVVRDINLLGVQYATLDQGEKDAIRKDLTTRYGIDAGTQQQLDALDAQPGFWEKAALGILQTVPAAVAHVV